MMLSHQRSAKAIFQNPPPDSPDNPILKPFTCREQSPPFVEFHPEHCKPLIPTLHLEENKRTRQFSIDCLAKGLRKNLMASSQSQAPENWGSQQEILKRVKHQLELLFEEYRLSKVNLIGVETAASQKELFERILELMRVCLGRGEKTISVATTEETDKTELGFLKETNEVLRRSEAWLKNKLDEMKQNWKEACDKILQLQSDLEDRDSQIFNIRRHESHTQRFISRMQSQFQKLNKEKDANLELLEQNDKLSKALTDLQIQKHDMLRLLQQKGQFIVELESIIEYKNLQRDKTQQQLTRLKQKYNALRAQKKFNMKLVKEQQRLINAAEKFKEKYGCDSRINHQQPKLSEILKGSTESVISRNSSESDGATGVVPPHVYCRSVERWKVPRDQPEAEAYQ